VELVATSAAVPERPAGRSATAASRHPAIVAVRTAPDAGEIEVHVRDRETRTVGRAPTADGLAGAAGATLDALRQAGVVADVTVAWARTVETAPGRFVVAVALQDGGRELGHGVAAGASPLEAAARAALDATRPDD
jgi:hypothetical protein